MKRTAAIALLLLVNVSAFAKPSDIVYGTRTGHKYHRAGCQYLRTSKIKMTVKEANRKGLTPCSKCNPPTMSAVIEHVALLVGMKRHAA